MISSSATPRTVAVVDDQPYILIGLSRLLNASGMAAEVFSSAEEFLEAMQSSAVSEVSCLVLDIHLGGMSGIELKRRMTAAGSRIPVIFMTAMNDEAVRREAMAAGCVAFLGKPFSGGALVEALRLALD